MNIFLREDVNIVSTDNYRSLFSGIERKVLLANGEQIIPINFDNAATTPPLKKVDEFICENITMYGSVGRGGQKSEYCTNAYEISREMILKFFSLEEKDGYDVIYVKNTTEGINLLANILCDRNSKKILTTRMEHHANDLPWRELGKTFYCEVDEHGKLRVDDFEEKLKRARGTIRYVSVTGVSNVTGYVNPIHQLAKIAHRYGAKCIIDGAQMVAHRSIQIKGKNEEESIDALVFSGHKMYAPFGSGVVIAKREMIAGKRPFLLGGGAVEAVFDDDVYYKETPYKDEAGTPNFLGAMSIIAAMSVLKNIGYDKIVEHENILRDQLIRGLKSLPCIELYGDVENKERVGVIPFNVRHIEHNNLGKLLQDKRAIAVRTGCFCAHPYVTRLLKMTDEQRYKYMEQPSSVPIGMVRASFGLYNTEEEVDEFLNCLEDIIRNK